VGRIIEGANCPIRVDRYGTAIGWCPLSSVEVID
jgi:hypothetical protein